MNRVLIQAVSLIVFFFLCLWILLYRLGEPNFYHVRNESRRAQIVREMLRSGNWLIPHLEEEPILTKPPLFYWAAALCSRGGTVTEGSVRLPSALAGVGIVLISMLLARAMFGWRAAWVSGWVLLTTNFFMHQTRYAELEALLALFTTAATYCFWRAATAASGTRRWFCLFYLMLGLGMMTKGPFALTFPLIPIIGFVLLYKKSITIVRRDILLPSLLFFIVMLPWPCVVMYHYPDFYKLVLWETVIRAATGYVHQEPVYYYFTQLPREFFPWIFVLPCAALLALGARCASMRRQLVFILLWFFGNLVFMSLLKSKRDYYLFPLTPAAALLVGATWEVLWRWAQEKIATTAAWLPKVLCTTGLVCAGAAAAVGNPCEVNFPAIRFPEGSPLLFFFALIMLLPWCCKRLARHMQVQHAVLGAVVLYMIGAHYLYFTLTVPIRNAEDSGKAFYRTVSILVPHDAALGFLKDYENYSFVFYAQRPVTLLDKETELRSFMDAPERRFAVLTGKAFGKIHDCQWSVVFHSPFAEHRSWRGYVLLCNQPFYAQRKSVAIAHHPG